MSKIETLRFLEPTEVNTVAAEHGTPVFVYDEATLFFERAVGKKITRLYDVAEQRYYEL